MTLSRVHIASKEITKDDLEILKKEFKQELKSLLSYWSTETLDEENGGFIGEIDHCGTRVKKASKGSIVNARILWTFSAAYRIFKKEEYKVIADRAYSYLINHFWDKQNGGLFWEVDYLGNPINKRKQAYAQGFGVYAFSEYYRATETVESLNLAIELFNILEQKFWDTKYSGYIEALTEDWREIEDMRLSEKDLNAPKSMNTHLHILEPYTNLYKVWPNHKLKESIQAQINLFSSTIIDAETSHLKLFFEKDWKPISNEISFGHDIEAAWLLNEASIIINNGELDKRLAVKTIDLVESTISEGMDEDSSVFNELYYDKLDRDKHWWQQAEAMVGLIDAFQVYPNMKYLKHLSNVWSFIKNKMIDTKNGEWYWRVDKKGIPYTDEVKVGFWKCPYHNGRALMELIERIEKIK
jgi:mannobiose 2-epimerase